MEIEIENLKKLVDEQVKFAKKVLFSEYKRFIAALPNIEFDVFDYKRPYLGETKNKIFFTYIGHYRFGTGAGMQVGTLFHPHALSGDRGYIKGCVTDLEGYMLLLQIKRTFDSYLNQNPTPFPWEYTGNSIDEVCTMLK